MCILEQPISDQHRFGYKCCAVWQFMLQTFPNTNKHYKHIIYSTKHIVKLRLTSLVYQLVKGALRSFREEILIRRERELH